jgi:RHS repeat-associated protein
MAGISRNALKGMNYAENRLKFNSAELNVAFDLNSYEVLCRIYDPQIGRWHSLDTKPNEMFSFYAAKLNNLLHMLNNMEVGNVGLTIVSDENVNYIMSKSGK